MPGFPPVLRVRSVKTAPSSPKESEMEVKTAPPSPARPNEPAKGSDAWYRGWECGYDATAASWGAEGWRAAKGGWDLDCRHTSGRTWSDLLDEIDAEEDEE
jgi:hypothetical protein